MEIFTNFPITNNQDAIFHSKSPFPLSNYRCIVFPFDIHQTKYDYSSFRSEFTANKLSDYEIIMFFEQMYKSVKLLNRITPQYIHRQLRYLVLFPLVLFVTGAILRLGSKYESEIVGKWILQFGSLLYFLAGSFYLYRTTRRLEDEIRIKVADFAASENRRIEEKFKIKWRVPEDHFYWLELDLSFKDQEEEGDLLYKIIKKKGFTEVNVIRFEFDDLSRAYEKAFYTSEMTEGCYQKHELDHFFYQLNQKFGEDFIKDKSSIQLRLLVGTFLLLFSIGIICSILGDPYFAHLIMIVDMTIFLLSGINILSQKNQHQLATRLKIKEFLDVKNNELRYRGIRWVLPPPYYNIIELWLDYKYVLEISEQQLPKPEISHEEEISFRDPNILPGYKWGDRIDLSRIRPPPGMENVVQKVGLIEYDDRKPFFQFVALGDHCMMYYYIFPQKCFFSL